MKFSQMVKEITVKEGKKSQVKVGDVREILTIVSEMIVSNEDSLKSLLANGKRRLRLSAKKQVKKVIKKTNKRSK